MNDQSGQRAAQSGEPSTAKAKRFRWRWVWIAVGLVVVLHPLLFGAVGDFLSIEPAAGPYDAAILVSGDHRIQAVADLHDQEMIKSVWLVPERPDYLVTHGLLPPSWEVSHKALVTAGLPPESIEVLDGNAADVTDLARIVSRRLAQSPQTDVLVICEGLECRHLRIVFDDVLGERHSSRLHVRGLPYDRFEMSRWWHSRSGWKAVLSQSCSIGFTWLSGTVPREIPESMDAEAYERRLIRDFGQHACHEF